MDYLPIFYSIAGKPCLVVGGGAVAARKVELLHKAGGRIRVIAPDIGQRIQELEEQGHLVAERREFDPADIEGNIGIIAATNDDAVNGEVSRLAQSAEIPVNVVDDPELCTFITPAMIDRSPIQIAISSGGASPVMTRMLRSQLESSVPGAFGELARLADSFREQVKQALPDVDARRHFWEQVLEGQVSELVFAGRMNEARALLQQELDDYGSPELRGEVYLVGAGPGDPDLITFKALRLMQKADVVLYDRLVSEPILDMVRRDAEKIYAGKASSNHSMPQESINQMLIRLAKQGNGYCA